MTTAPVDNAARPASAMPVDQFARLRRIRDWTASWLTTWFGLFDSILSGAAAWIVAIALVAVLQVVLIVLHRPWLDELQALQLSVQSPAISDLLFNLRYEGHPPLWYLILRGLAALCDDPLRALPLASLLIALPVQLTILLASPFGRAERVMLALSELVLFEFLTISRSLTLGVALLVMIAALWKRRRLVWLLIAILPLCDFLFGAVSLLLVAMRWRERRFYAPGALAWVAFSLFAAWSIRPMPDIASALLPRGGPLSELALWMANFSTLGLPLQWNDGALQWNSPPPPGLGGPALIGFLVMAWIELRKKPDYALALGAFILLTLVFSVTVYELSIRHLAIAAALLIMLVWCKTITGPDGNTPRSVWWRAWLLVGSLCGVLTAGINLVEPFDTAPEAGAVINRMGLHDKTWVAFLHSAGQGVAALNSMKFERLGEHCSEDFVRWNAADDHRVTSARALTVRLARKVAQDGRFYLLSQYQIHENPPLLRRLAAVPHGYDGHDFYLYVVGENAPDARPHGVDCVGPHPALQRRSGL